MAKATISSRAKQVLAEARKMRRNGADWVFANNAILGLGGAVARLFPTRAERQGYFKSPEAAEVGEILDSLSEPTGSTTVDSLEKCNGKILVRVPRTVHAALLAEAEGEGVSLNHLIASKLAMQLRALV